MITSTTVSSKWSGASDRQEEQNFNPSANPSSTSGKDLSSPKPSRRSEWWRKISKRTWTRSLARFKRTPSSNALTVTEIGWKSWTKSQTKGWSRPKKSKLTMNYSSRTRSTPSAMTSKSCSRGLSAAAPKTCSVPKPTISPIPKKHPSAAHSATSSTTKKTRAESA